MSCYRFDLHRKYLHYLHELLPPASHKKIEDHLLNCRACVARIERLKATERMLSALPRFSPANDPWPRLKAGLWQMVPVSNSAPLWKRVAIIAVFGLLSGLIGAATYGKLASHETVLESIHTDEFKPVSIMHMASTTEPHVVTEGYVTEARIEREDGDTIFKLVENPNSSGPFVICEVIDTLNLPIPPVGSRVRVYGVSRYDGKSDHNWHEVHPVLNIQVLKN